jgi:hypothetical protein
VTKSPFAKLSKSPALNLGAGFFLDQTAVPCLYLDIKKLLQNPCFARATFNYQGCTTE